MLVFALDVGTRKVTGLIGNVEDDVLTVLDFETIEHPYRYMLDGQIHNIEGVAKVISTVKKKLEDRNETKLEEAAVAVAGRFLKTVVSEAELELPNAIVDQETVKQLEFLAVSKVPLVNEDGTELQCVGYSPIEYKLDGLWMKSLVGHRGRRLYVKVVVALLPNQVVEAMLATLRKANLRASFMTLEPIAALEISVPEDLRILNIALVDIGAGTSDIAISKGGTVVGYEMVPLAGDEITEALAQNYLLDFHTADQVKRFLEQQETLEVMSVTNQLIKIASHTAFETIGPVVQTVAEAIAERIVKLNNGVPSVVLLVGGGAKLSMLRSKIANCLKLPEDRVSLKTVESLNKVRALKEGFVGSEYVTVSGIAYMAAQNSGSVYDSIEINGENVRLLKIGQSQTVLHALLAAGYALGDILGDVRPSFSFQLNGEKMTIPQKRLGGLRILLNGMETPLYQRVRSGDSLRVEKLSYDTDEDSLLIRYVKPYVIIVDGDEKAKVYPEVYVNSKAIEDINYKINDGDEITVERINPEELANRFENNAEEIVYTLNGEERRTKRYRLKFVAIEENESEIRISFENVPTLIKDIIIPTKSIKIKLNGSEVVLTRRDNLVMVDGNYIPSDSPLLDGMNIVCDDYKPIVADVLALVNFDLRRVKDYTLLVNGNKANFTQELCDGDEVIFKYIEKSS